MKTSRIMHRCIISFALLSYVILGYVTSYAQEDPPTPTNTTTPTETSTPVPTSTSTNGVQIQYPMFTDSYEARAGAMLRTIVIIFVMLFIHILIHWIQKDNVMRRIEELIVIFMFAQLHILFIFAPDMLALQWVLIGLWFFLLSLRYIRFVFALFTE